MGAGKGKIIVSIGIFAILFRVFLVRKESGKDDVYSSIKDSGYDAQLHYVTTADGYILGLHRIMINSNSTQHSTNKDSENLLPILFVHGLESSPLDWLQYQGKNSLPYLLLENGYDVWLGNVRGTPSSKNHTNINPNNDAQSFWNYSFHEIGYYDLPAMVDYISNSTNKEKIYYIGVSQGEATYLIMSATRPEYNNKIKLAILTSPSSHLKHSDNLLFKTLGNYWNTLERATSILGIHNVMARNIMGSFCQYPIFSLICRPLTFPLTGYAHSEQLPLGVITKMYQIYPINSSSKQFLHYLQIYNSGIFRQYDYGTKKNIKVYGSTEPPEYDMKQITSPVAYFWGENDCWSRPKDVEELSKKLPNLVLNYKVPDRLFNHYDIYLAKDAKALVYDKMIETIKTRQA